MTSSGLKTTDVTKILHNGRYISVTVLIIIFFSFPLYSPYSKSIDSTVQMIAQAYGIEHFDEIESISFTFNASVNEKLIERTWKWYPRLNTVKYKSDNGLVSYIRKDPDLLTAEIRAVDSRFINDIYWLLFPFHIIWDEGTDITVEENAELPVGEGTATRVTVRYPREGGYTPGDVYELYVDQDFTIREWVYRRGGASEPTRVTTWEDHRKSGPLLISFVRIGDSDRFRVWFSDVNVSVTGESG